MITYLEAAAAGRLAVRAGGAAERRPAVLGPPRERLAGVPGGAVGAHGAQVPAVLSRAVVGVGRPDVARLLRRGGRGTGAKERRHARKACGHLRQRSRGG